MKKKVAIHMAEGFEEVEAISIVDLLRRADINVLMVSMAHQLEVKGAHEIVVRADVLFEDVDYKDIFMMVLPGGMPGASNLDSHNGLKQQIKQFEDQDRPLAAICAAPMVLGKLGILKDKQAVCYPGYEKYLVDAQVLKVPVVESENVITGRGVGTALEFGLKLIEKIVSPEKAREIAKQILAEEKLVTS
jgi:4-methyl-5(b-hydroxyethyl)-thiazole monophosphate biosynthesis